MPRAPAALLRIGLAALFLAAVAVAVRQAAAAPAPDAPLVAPATSAQSATSTRRLVVQLRRARSARAQGLRSAPILEAGPLSDRPAAPAAPGSSPVTGGSVSQVISVVVPCVSPTVQHCSGTAAPAVTRDSSRPPLQVQAIAAVAAACTAVRPARRRSRSARRAGRPIVL